MKKKELKKDLEQSAEDLKRTFEEKALEKSNVELTKDELKDFKDRFKKLPPAMQERNLDVMRVDKKLRVIEQDMRLQERLTAAIDFLDSLDEDKLTN